MNFVSVNLHCDATQGHTICKNQVSIPINTTTTTTDDLRNMSTTARQVDIRLGAVKRLTKEMKSRIVDVETEKQRTQRLISAGEDRWTVGKQVSFPTDARVIRTVVDC